MLTNIQTLSFDSGEIVLSECIRKKSTSFEYIGTGQSLRFLIKSSPIHTRQFKEIYDNEILSQSLIPKDPHILSLLDQKLLPLAPELGILKFEYPENGTLKKFMKSHDLNDEQRIFIFKEIVLAVLKINDSGIVHRDITPHNIWIDKNYNFKLSGFERSIRLENNDENMIKLDNQRLVHPAIRPIDNCLEKMDVWGLGCLLYYLIFREYPFINGFGGLQISDHLKEILNLCLNTDPNERPMPRTILSIINNRAIPTCPQFFKSNQPVPVINLRYSGTYCLEKTLTKDVGTPDLFYIQQIAFTIWTKSYNINKLLDFILKTNKTVTIVAVKSLIIIHRLLLSGPKEIITTKLSENLSQILALWQNNIQSDKDEYFSDYFSGLIRQLSRVLIEKIKFHCTSKTLSNWKSTIDPSYFNEGVAYLSKVIRICEGLTMEYEILSSIKFFLAMQLVEECQRVINCLSPLDKTSELKEFSNRLASLNFNLNGSKPEKHQTEGGKGIILNNEPKNEERSKDINEESKINQLFINTDKNSEIEFSHNPSVIKNEKISKNYSSDGSSKIDDFSNLLSFPVQEFSKTTSNFHSRNTHSKQAHNGSDFNNNPDNLFADFLDFGSYQNSNNLISGSKEGIRSKSPAMQSLMANNQNANKNVVNPRNDSKSAYQNIPHFKKAVDSNKPSTVSELNIPAFKLNPPPMNESFSNMNQNPSIMNKNPSILNSTKPLDQLIKNSQNSPSSKSLQKPTTFHQKVPEKPKVFSIEKRWIISQSDLKIGPVLGMGASCSVYKGEYKRTPVAIKAMRESYTGQNIVQEFQREVSAMVTIRHPNLVLFMGACIEPSMMIISEFCAGESLFKLLHEKKSIQLHWKQKLKMIIDIARGMHYLHESNPPILHRDLKSLNLLLLDQVNTPNDNILVKITDFGISRILEESQARMTVRMGTCHWMAPEVMNSEPYSLAADVYSFGIVVWEIAARETPYKGLNSYEVPLRVMKGERPDLKAISAGIPERIKTLISLCWDQSPAKRPTFKQILEFLNTVS